MIKAKKYDNDVINLTKKKETILHKKVVEFMKNFFLISILTI